MSTRELSAASGIGLQTKNVPDLMIARTITARADAMKPLAITHRCWDLDFGGHGMQRARKRIESRLLEQGFEVLISEAWEFGSESVLASKAGELLHLRVDAESVIACVYAGTAERADEILHTTERLAKGSATRRSSSGLVSVRFWHLGSDGPASYLRRVRCPRWQDIAANYPAVAPTIESLLRVRRPYERGNFVFWHGPAGTGKTSALRALMREWVDMDVEVITDPDAFLGSPEYFNELLIEPTEKDAKSERRSRRGRLLVLEDAPELIHAEQSPNVRATLSKLLNISDGVLSHELKLVLLATTHERGSVPSSGLTRPGRKLQVLEFPRLTGRQAKEWLQNHERTPPQGLRDASLAELYASLGSDVAFEPQDSIGFAPAAN